MNKEELTLRRGLRDAKRLGLSALADRYQEKLNTLLCEVPDLPKRNRPKVTFVVDHKGWCGERLSLNLTDELKDYYDCNIVRLGDKEHLSFDSDLYVYRNISWLLAVKVPQKVLDRTIVLCEGERTFRTPYCERYPDVLGVVPLNYRLLNMVKRFNPKHVFTPIGNGIDTKSFAPSYDYPKEFTVGCAGNFSLDYYDDWKGFSRYIVPACKKAGVKLEWRGWIGKSQTPGLVSKQAKLDDMPDFYRKLSCFVLMSKSEGCSGVTFEALSCGIPVISTKVGWHGEQENTGIIWVTRPEEETPEAVQKAIDNLTTEILRLKSRNLEMIGKQSRSFAKQYSWSLLAKEWKRAFDYYLAVSKNNEKHKAGAL